MLLAGWHPEPALRVRAPAMDRHERDAGVRDGRGGHLRGVPQRVVLRGHQQHAGKAKIGTRAYALVSSVQLMRAPHACRFTGWGSTCSWRCGTPPGSASSSTSSSRRSSSGLSSPASSTALASTGSSSEDPTAYCTDIIVLPFVQNCVDRIWIAARRPWIWH